MANFNFIYCGTKKFLIQSPVRPITNHSLPSAVIWILAVYVLGYLILFSKYQALQNPSQQER